MRHLPGRPLRQTANIQKPRGIRYICGRPQAYGRFEGGPPHATSRPPPTHTAYAVLLSSTPGDLFLGYIDHRSRPAQHQATIHKAWWGLG